MLWGAFLGVLPDFDVFIPLGGPVDDFVYHRGFSHSVFLLAILSPIFAWLITKVHPNTKKQFKKWLLLTFLVLETSVILDLLTVYGTQILWPFDKTPLACPIFFIVDPLFTLPLLIGIFAAFVLRRNSSFGHRMNTIGLVISTIYFLWAFGAGMFVDNRVRHKLAQQQVHYSDLIASPAPFTTLLWRIVGIDGNQYFETYFSILDGQEPLLINHYPRNLELLRGVEKHPPVVKLKWFTKGNYAITKKEEHIVMTDLRMGLEPNYVFRFKIAKAGNLYSIPIREERVRMRPDWSHLIWVWKRIWQPIPNMLLEAGKKKN